MTVQRQSQKLGQFLQMSWPQQIFPQKVEDGTDRVAFNTPRDCLGTCDFPPVPLLLPQVPHTSVKAQSYLSLWTVPAKELQSSTSTVENPQEENGQKGLQCSLKGFQFPGFQGTQQLGVPGACGHKSSVSEGKRGSFLGRFWRVL